MLTINAYAQNSRKQIDSMQRMLQAAPNDTSAYYVLFQLYNLFDKERNADSSLFYAKQMYALATRLNAYRLQIKALGHVSHVYRFLNFNYQKAAETQFEALKLAEAKNDTAVHSIACESL